MSLCTPAGTRGMADFFAELKRRHIYRVAAAYAVVAWVLLQIVNNIAPGLDLPNWAVTLVILLLAVGFPIALVFAWILELKAPAEDRAALQTKNTKLDLALLGALAVVIAIFVYQQAAPTPGATAAQNQASEASAAPRPGAISVAVLPFVNLSSDKEQEFFSDGMTEEITSALAKVVDLRVVGRTSAFEFKGQNKDLRSIGQALSATHLIEGSVRKDGNEVRITAQLIKADDGTHLWTESYNRELKGVFAMQEEIATAIASALRVPLGLKEGQSLVANRTSDTDSYQDYLRARALVRGRGVLEPGGPLTQAAKLLEQVVARDPNYAPAWGLLGQAYALTPVFTAAWANGSTDALRLIETETMRKAEAAAQQAIRLAPAPASAGAFCSGIQLSYRSDSLGNWAKRRGNHNPQSIAPHLFWPREFGRSLCMEGTLQRSCRCLAGDSFGNLSSGSDGWSRPSSARRSSASGFTADYPERWIPRIRFSLRRGSQQSSRLLRAPGRSRVSRTWKHSQLLLGSLIRPRAQDRSFQSSRSRLRPRGLLEGSRVARSLPPRGRRRFRLRVILLPFMGHACHDHRPLSLPVAAVSLLKAARASA